LDAPVIPDAVTPPAQERRSRSLSCAIGKRFGEEAAVEDLSFTLHAGEIFALIGLSGAARLRPFA
jgi:ABC-type glutathione transport system ATPase component